MGFSDGDKIMTKNLHDSKGYQGYAPKKLMSFLKKIGAKADCPAASCLPETNQ